MSLNHWHDALTKSVLKTHRPFDAMKQTKDKFTADQRIHVYQNNYHQGLLSVLETSYPNTRQIVGDQYFNQLSSSFVESHPPQIADLNQYGNAFPPFIQLMLEQRPELSAMGYLADLAGLDWLLYQVYFAPDRKLWPAVDFQALTAEEQADCSLFLSPDIYLISSPWPLYALWQLNREEIDSVDLDSHTGEEYLVVYRDRYKPAMEPVSGQEFDMLVAIQNEQTITYLTRHYPEHMNRLPGWIQRGWLSDFRMAQQT